MMQLRDPMYASQTGNIIAQAGSDVSQRLMQLPQLLRENEIWKRNEAGFKSKQEFKKRMFDAVRNDLLKIGVDPSTLQLPDPSNPDEDAADFAAKVGKVVYPHFVGAGSKLNAEDAAALGLSQEPAVADAVARQRLLDQNQPMQQINLNGKAGDQLPVGGPMSSVETEPDPMLRDILGMKEAQPAKADEDAYSDPLEKALLDEVRAGTISAAKASEELRGVRETREKIKLANVQKERDEAKQRARDAENRWGATVSGALGTNRVTVPGGGPITKENVQSAQIGEKLPKEFAPRSGGGRYGVGADDDLYKVYERLYNNVTTFYNTNGDLKSPDFEGLATQAKRAASVAYTAYQLQQRAGGPEAMDNDTAFQRAEEMKTVKDAVASAIPKWEEVSKIKGKEGEVTGKGFVPSKPFTPIDPTDPKAVLKNVDAVFGGLKSQSPAAYASIVEALNNGYSLQAIIDFLSAQGVD